MNPVSDILSRYSVIVLDGALATELERRGCDLKDSLWSAKVLLENPEVIKQVHMDYFLAGADCAITASYQATIPGFAKRGLNEEQATALIKKSVNLAKEARDEFWEDEGHHMENKRPRPFVAASVGPYGAFLADGSEYRGDYGLTESELMEFHRPRMQALVEAKPDLLACESIPNFIEAQALAHLLGEFPSAHAWISFTAKDGTYISDGTKLKDCIAWLNDFPQIAAVGVNCTSPEFIPLLIHEAQSATSKPILVYPNSGETFNTQADIWNGDAYCEAFGTTARDWYAAGARLIGGCCRTTPEDIQEIAAWARGEVPFPK